MAIRMRLVPPPLREDPSPSQAGILARLVILAVLGLVALAISAVAA